MDYLFDDKLSVKLIALFIINSFGMPAPHSSIVDIIMLNPFVNYFDMEQCLSELTETGYVTFYIEDNTRFYNITTSGKETLTYFSARLPLTVRERLVSAVKLKEKEIRKSLGIDAHYEIVNEIEYKVNLSITEGTTELFGLSISVGDKKTALKMCNSFKKDPQFFYSEVLSLLLKEKDEDNK